MSQFFRVLMFSPRLTLIAIMVIFGVIGGKVSRGTDERKPANAWSTQGSERIYSAQARRDDGWGSKTHSTNPRDDGRAAVTRQKIWRDKDGVIYEEEDIKAFDRSEYE